MFSPKKIFALIFFLSLPFVVWYLYKLNLVSLNLKELNIFWLALSMLTLSFGFVLGGIGWKYALKVHNYNISSKKAIISHGLPVFAKYIPGKVWVILGRASFVSNETLPLRVASFISLKEQLVYLLIGLFVSFPFLVFHYNNPFFPFFVGLIILGLTSFLMVKKIHISFLKIFKKVFKKELAIPFLSIDLLLKLGVLVSSYWIVWILSFYLLLKSMPIASNITMAFGFPVSICMGLLAIIIPAGIGVREGILISFLTSTGLNIEHAVTVSIISRVWFIAGEVFVFLFAIFLKYLNNIKNLLF